MKKINKLISEQKVSIILSVALIVSIAFMAYTINLLKNASQIGGSLGTEAGSLVGNTLGTIAGAVTEFSSGINDGTEAGLSAEDTVARIGSELNQISHLDVMTAKVQLTDFHSIGKSVKYAALYLINGTVTFSVDLNDAEIERDDEYIFIYITEPKGTLHIDYDTIELVGEYQRKFFNGSNQTGYEAFLNSVEKTAEASEETIDNYIELKKEAKALAKAQIESLVSSIIVDQNAIVRVIVL